MTTKADDNGPFKEFTFEDWLRDGFEGMCSRMNCKPVNLDTAEFEAHMRNSAREQLLAMRNLVDKFIDYIDEQPDDETSSA